MPPNTLELPPELPKIPPDELDPNVELGPPKGFLFELSELAAPPKPPRKPPPPLELPPPNIEPEVEEGVPKTVPRVLALDPPPNTDPEES